MGRTMAKRRMEIPTDMLISRRTHAFENRAHATHWLTSEREAIMRNNGHYPVRWSEFDPEHDGYIHHITCHALESGSHKYILSKRMYSWEEALEWMTTLKMAGNEN